MAVKFSAFTTRTGTLDASTRIVGYDDPAGTKTNVEFTLATLQANSGIYAADGTIGTTRKSLGLGASTTDSTQIAIGSSATVTAAHGIALGLNSSAGGSGIAIGAMASHVTTAGLHSIAMGGSTRAAGNYSVAIGYNCGSNSTSVNSCVNIGSSAQGDGASSITLSANAAGDVTTSTANTFGVYMSSNTTPDFRISHDGDSYITGSGKFGIGRSNITATLDVTHYDASRKLASFSDNTQTEVFSIENNGTVKIAGQAYTPPHVIVDDLTVDWNNSNVQTRTLASGANTFTPSNAEAGATYILKLTQPSSGTATIAWESTATVNWPGGTAPTLSGTGKIDIVTLICTTGGATGGTFYANATLDFS